MKRRLPLRALLITPFLSLPAQGEVTLRSWDADGDGNVSLNEWDRNFEEKDVFFRLRESAMNTNESEGGQFEFALPHLEEAYDSNISIELFTY